MLTNDFTKIETTDKEFLDCVKKQMKTLHITMNDIANVSGMSRQSISSIFNERTKLTKSHRILIAYSLNEKIDEFFGFSR